MLAVCISFPHRHTGNSVKPGTSKGSNADMGYLIGRENPPANITVARARSLARHPKNSPALPCSSRLFKIAHLDCLAANGRVGSSSTFRALSCHVRFASHRFSNRPFRVKRFQTNHHHYSVDVAHGLVLLFGIGTRPFHHGSRRRGGTIYRAALPLDERQVQAIGRTHLIHRAEASRNVDGGTIGQRHHGANAGGRHQALAHLVIADDGQQAAM